MSNYVTAELPREKLKQLIEKNGETLLDDPDRTEALLRDHCGPHRREISALVGALEERVPLELKSSWQSAMTPEAMRARLVQRLEENRGLSTEVATWAVDAWSYALGVGLARRSDPVAEFPAAAVGAGGVALAEAEASADTHAKSVAERVASDRVGGALVTPDNGKNGLQAAFNTPKKAGIGAVVALGLAAGAFAMFHHPTPPPPPPSPQKQTDGGSQGSGSQQGGSQQGGSQQGGTQGNNGNGGSGANGGANSQGNTQSGSVGGNSSASDQNGGSSGLGAGHASAAQPALQIPVGTPIPIRVDRSLNSEDLNEGDLVDATVSSPVTVNGDVVIRTGARAHLRVVSIDRTGQTNGSQHLRLALVDVVTAQGRVTVASHARDFAGPKASQDAVKRAGVGGAVGAVGGFVVGHFFHHGGAGAAAGAGAGAVGGAVTAKAGPVKIAAEAPMQFQLTRAVHP